MNMDSLTRALNSPTGALVESLFELIPGTYLHGGAGMPEQLRSRIEHLVSLEGAAGEDARVLVASRIPLLFYLEPQWARNTVLGLLDWGRNQNALEAWGGFLWGARISPSLWQEIKPHFLMCARHTKELGKFLPRYASVFAAVAIEGRDTFTNPEATRIMLAIGDAGRASVAGWIQGRLEGAQEKAAELWRTRVGDWIQRCWPATLEGQGPLASFRLCFVVLETGDALGEAVEVVLPRLTRVIHGMVVINLLTKAAVAGNAKAVVRLANALLGSREDRPYGIKGLLQRVVELDPTVAIMPEYGLLRELQLKYEP